MELGFETTIIYWRGPSPFFYAPLPPDAAEEVRKVSRLVTYGWGVIPVAAEIGGVRFSTSLFPKDGGYLLPVKAEVRKKTGVTAGDPVAVVMTIRAEPR